MKRRKAIGSILLAGTAVVAGFGGYEWYSITKNPDKIYLRSKKRLIEDLADIIIPATDTPGAREAGAIEFFMRILEECTDDKTMNRFVTGLQALEDFTKSQYQREFSNCSEKEKISVLTYFDLKSRKTQSIFQKAKNKFTGRPFFETLKSYTVQSYCISEKGATLGLQYLAVPGKYLSCIPLDVNQKAWATK